MFTEKRRFPRAGVRCKINVVFGERILVFNVLTENISAGGMMAVLDQKLHVPTMVELELFIPGREKPLKCSGQTSRVKESKPGAFEVAIKFLDINDAVKGEISKFVNSAINNE